MKDEFEATFVVEMAQDDVWEALTRRTVEGEGDAKEEVHYVLAGFPSFPALDVPGASCTLIEMDAGRLLRVKKDHFPCAGTEIAVRLEQAETGTRVTVVQSGFGPFLDAVGRDTVVSHGHQIVRDLHLYLVSGLTVPGTEWGPSLGAVPKQTAVGLELASVEPAGFCANAGMGAGDLLLTLRGIRVHDLQQLWTVLALTQVGTDADVTWARNRERMMGKATF